MTMSLPRDIDSSSSPTLPMSITERVSFLWRLIVFYTSPHRTCHRSPFQALHRLSLYRCSKCKLSFVIPPDTWINFLSSYKVLIAARNSGKVRESLLKSSSHTLQTAAAVITEDHHLQLSSFH